jgi:hypothetical protein
MCIMQHDFTRAYQLGFGDGLCISNGLRKGVQLTSLHLAQSDFPPSLGRAILLNVFIN